MPNLNGLLPLLQRLDHLLTQAVAVAETLYGPEAAKDPYQGLHIDPGTIANSLHRPPGTPLFQVGDIKDIPLMSAVPEDSPLVKLQQTYGLSAFDLDLVVIALAPELDRRYEQLYAYLQNDVRRHRPTVDLALNLLCSDPTTKLARRDHFATDAPLIQHRLLHLVGRADRDHFTLLTHDLQLDDQIVRLLLDQPGLDQRLVATCELVRSQVALDTLPVSVAAQRGLTQLTQQAWNQHRPLRLYFQGPDRTGNQRLAATLASAASAPLLVTDLERMLAAQLDIEQTFRLIYREAWLQKAWVYFKGLDQLTKETQAIVRRTLGSALATHPTLTILSGQTPWVPPATGPLGVITIPLPLPTFAQRRYYWQTHLTQLGLPLSEAELDSLSDRFRLTPDQIADAVATTAHQAAWQVACGLSSVSSPQLSAFCAAARAQAGHDLATLARKIEPRSSWDDIVLPAKQKSQLQDLCAHAKYHHLVWETWEFERKLSLGKGLNALFSGPPGTGKTMAAEVIAHELELDLYQIDLSQVVSKYIGETEKNLNRIFTAAANSNAMLLFDEADALFGKRSEVRDAHDRYANIEVSYLLQKMEDYEGIAILTTNLRSNIDEAFVRRLRFIIEFPFPGEQERQQIWQQIWPDAIPLSSDLDLDFLARQFEVTGASIRNIALTAAFLAASDGGNITHHHLLGALRREYQKMGKILMESDFGHPIES